MAEPHSERRRQARRINTDMEFVPDCLQRMANRPAQLLVALSRLSK
jgi:hypothetical protein